MGIEIEKDFFISRFNLVTIITITLNLEKLSLAHLTETFLASFHPQINFRVYKIPPIDLVLRQVNLANSTTHCFCHIHLNPYPTNVENRVSS